MARQYFGINGTLVRILNSRSTAILNLLFFAGMLPFFTGCSGSRFLLQAARGQLALINHARPLDSVIHDPKTSPRLALLLREVPAIKGFGETQGLKPTQNYKEYVALDRPAAVWVVSACEKFKFNSKEWSFFIAGRFPYLGWFNLKDAQEYAEELKAEGWDVDVRPAGAYSTLGWFKDPILSSMISDGDDALGDLVNVVLHESVHASFYIDGQAYFNESLASFVADRLTLDYLKAKEGDPNSLMAYTNEQQSGETRVILLRDAYQALAKLYASPATQSEMTAAKEAIFLKLKADLKTKRDLNNASLVQFKTYATGEGEFDRIFAAAGSWAGFWEKVKSLNEKSFDKPQQEDLGAVLKLL